MQIDNFIKIREDGKEISCEMSAMEMIDRGWNPCKVIALKWQYQSSLIEIYEPEGIAARVVKGGNFVAATRQKGRENKSVLTIFSQMVT